MAWFFDTIKMVQAIPYVDFPQDNIPAYIVTIEDDNHPYLTDPTWLQPDNVSEYGYVLDWTGTELVRVERIYNENPADLRKKANINIRDALVLFSQNYLGNKNSQTRTSYIISYISSLTDWSALTDEEIITTPIPELIYASPIQTITPSNTEIIHSLPTGISSSTISLTIIDGSSLYQTTLRLCNLDVNNHNWVFSQSQIMGVKPNIKLSISNNGELSLLNNGSSNLSITTHLG